MLRENSKTLLALVSQKWNHPATRWNGCWLCERVLRALDCCGTRKPGPLFEREVDTKRTSLNCTERARESQLSGDSTTLQVTMTDKHRKHIAQCLDTFRQEINEARVRHLPEAMTGSVMISLVIGQRYSSGMSFSAAKRQIRFIAMN